MFDEIKPTDCVERHRGRRACRPAAGVAVADSEGFVVSSLYSASRLAAPRPDVAPLPFGDVKPGAWSAPR